MKIHVVQREGTRYFSRFTNLAERDRLQVELQIEDKNGDTISIDLTEALIEEYSKHPQIGKVSVPSPVVEIASLQPIKPLTTRRSRNVSPAYLSDSPHADILSRVRDAQAKAADEKKQKQAEIAAARAERLAAAREAKAQKLKVETQETKVAGGRRKAESGKSKAPSTKANASPAKATEAAPAKQAKASKPVVKAKTAKLKDASSAGITKIQAQAIKKIGKVLAKEEKGQRALVTSPRKTASAKAPAPTPKQAKAASAPKAATRKK